MASIPNEWKIPVWHKDFGDPRIELNLLKQFCNKLLQSNNSYSIELDCFEEGYMKVDIYKKSIKYGEVYITELNGKKQYGLFITKNNDEEEIYFSDITDGLKYF